MRKFIVVSPAVAVFGALLAFACGCSVVRAAEGPAGLRRVVSLDGTWEIAEGSGDSVPTVFPARTPVPGLVDLAVPQIVESGTPKSCFWYRKTFTIDGPVGAVAQLKIGKAMYGTRVVLNGAAVGEHWSWCTPGYFDVRAALKGGGVTNTLLVRVGPRAQLPKDIPDGNDQEKAAYLPGIYDSVELILSATPHIVRIKNAPDVTHNTVKVYVTIGNAGAATATTPVTVKVYEAKSGVLRGQASGAADGVPSGGEKEIILDVPVDQCQLWSPESPFLYRVVVTTAGDSAEACIGMRTIGWDAKTGKMLLNGKPYMLLGTNICIRRFEDDPLRGTLPWDEKWVRAVIRNFRAVNWNSCRYSIGFPPEVWYRVADEEGLLVQDEYPFWAIGKSKPGSVEEMTSEFTEWINERQNHACVFLFDPENEGGSKEGSAAARAVRGLDPQGRLRGIIEEHPYNDAAKLIDLNGVGKSAPDQWGPTKVENSPVIINEYAWMWLDRQGKPTKLLEYKWDGGSKENGLFSRYTRTAYKTEYHRMSRNLAGMMDFVGLTNCVNTADHWKPDLSKPEFNQYFLEYMPDAFSPLMIGINGRPDNPAPGSKAAVQVVLINDTYAKWSGKVVLRLQQNRKYLWTQTKDASVDALARSGVTFEVTYPETTGMCRLEALMEKEPGKVIRSVRDFGLGVEPKRIPTPADVIESKSMTVPVGRP